MLPSLPHFRKTLPLAANGVKKNSCKDRQNDMRKTTEKRKGHTPGTPSFHSQKDVFSAFGTESNGDTEWLRNSFRMKQQHV